MNDHIQPDGSAEHDHGALGDAEYAEFMELAAEEGDDELNADRGKLTLSFELPRGSYATLIVKAATG